MQHTVESLKYVDTLFFMYFISNSYPEINIPNKIIKSSIYMYLSLVEANSTKIHPKKLPIQEN